MSEGLLQRIMALLGANYYTTNGSEIIFYVGAGIRRYIIYNQDSLQEELTGILRGLENDTRSIW